MTTLLLLLTVHFIADFMLQSDWMAQHKAKRWDVLALHVGIYSACFLPFGLTFAAVTFALHFVQDAITSRMTARLWFYRFDVARPVINNQRVGTYPIYEEIPGRRHWFFVVIGLDQLLHAYALTITWGVLYGGW